MRVQSIFGYSSFYQSNITVSMTTYGTPEMHVRTGAGFGTDYGVFRLRGQMEM